MLFSVSTVNCPVPLNQNLLLTSDNVLDNLVFSQPISGLGFGITFAGIGTLVFDAVNTYDGGTTVTGGTLQMGISNAMPLGRNLILTSGIFDVNTTTQSIGNLTGSGATNIAATGLLNVTPSSNVTYAGTFAGAGDITKQGASQWQLTGASTGFTGLCTVAAGELKLNGTLGSGGAGDVTVNSGARFSGNATVGGTLTNSGTLTPGNSVGIFNVDTLVLNSGSIFQPEINDALQTDLITAASVGSVIDGRLDIVFLPGVYIPGLTYTIFNGPPSGFSGQFTSVTDNASLFDLDVIYDTTQGDILLTIVTSRSGVFFGLPLTGNAKAVAQNIDAISAAGLLFPDTDLFDAVASLVGQSFATIEDALLKLDPTPYTTIGASRAIISPMLASLYGGKSGADCCASSCECEEGQWNIWADPFGAYLDQKSIQSENGFRTKVGGIAIGSENCLTKEWKIGFGFAYDNVRIDWKHNRGHSSSNNVYGSLAANRQGENTYFACALLGGLDTLKNERKIQFVTTNETAYSRFLAPELIGRLSGAFFFKEANHRIDLYANLTSDTFFQPSFTENHAGGLCLDVKRQTSSVLVSELGVLLKVRKEFRNGCWGPDFWIAYVNETYLTNGKLRANFVNQTIPFTTVGVHKTQNLAEAGLSMTIVQNKGFSFTGTYFLQGGGQLMTQNGDLRFRWTF